MKITVQKSKLENFPCDLLVVKWVQEQKMDGSTGDVDKALGGALKKIISEEDFKGKEGEKIIFPTFGKIKAKKVMVLGLGEQKNVTVDCLRRSAARIVKEASKAHAKKVATMFIGTGSAGIDPFIATKALTEGALLGAYQYNKYKSKENNDQTKTVSEFTIVTSGVHEKAKGSEQEKIRAAEQGVKQGEAYARATIFARDLVNEPARTMTPKNLAEIARTISKEQETISVEILNITKIEKLGMGGYLGIAQGSDHPPYFVHLMYKPKGVTKKLKKIALIGKGITFDSGGLSLKPANSMESMKTDMAGCATMLGVFSVLPKLKPQIEVHGISAICENMPSGKALRPGDILTTMSGKTIEILNTDAEGRVTLADAITYAVRLKPDAMIDIATLTGACIGALGEEVAGYMGNDKKLLEQVRNAAEQSGELIWELPLIKEYQEFIKSHIADYTNITPGKKGGGAITAGLFLQEFVENIPWVHIDIAGPSWAEKEIIPYNPRGGTGFGVRTMLELLKYLSEEK